MYFFIFSIGYGAYWTYVGANVGHYVAHNRITLADYYEYEGRRRARVAPA